jgi:hypothetical protein
VSTTADLVTMAGGSAARVYAAGAVPPTPQYPYRVIGYGPNAPVVRTANGTGNPVRRFWVQHFARTSDNLETAAAATFATFDGKSIGGDVCTQEIATLPDRDADDNGVLTTTHTYRF